MAQVCQHSWCNIVTSKASNGNEGCFTKRTRFAVQQCRVLSQWDSWPARHYYLKNNTMWDRIENNPLNKRGWVMQESILAPRILHFSSDQVLWQCTETTKSTL
jgi:hypothetical protein